jgi:NADH dehydrogenase
VARVLVTGASGFIGSALVPRLVAAGHAPRLFLRRPPRQAPAPPIDVALGDLTDPPTLRRAVAGVDAVVHLGAATSAGRTDPAMAYRVNVGGASALVEACRAGGCRRLVAVSTQHVHLPRPGAYGRTKRIADAIFLRSGLDVTVLRPSLVYGAGGQGVFARIAALAEKLPVIPVVGPGQWHLRPVWVEDLVGVILQTLARPETIGRTYDVGGLERVTYDEMLAGICAALGKPCRPLHLPVPLCFVLAWLLERVLANPPLTTENVHGALVEAPCDLSALERDLRPAITPFAEGLRRTLGKAA